MVSCAIWIDRSLRLGFPNSSASSRPRKRWPHWEGSLVDVIPLDLARDRRFGGIVRVLTPIPTPLPPPPPHPLDNRIRRSRATASSPLSTPSTIASSLPSSISVILFPIAVTFYITWWFIHFVDGFFSPIYAQLSINIFCMHIVLLSSNYPQIEVEFAIFIMHPSKLALPYHLSYSGDEELCCVYVPTNHLYIGDIFLVNSKDVIRPNLPVHEGIGTPCLRKENYFHSSSFR
ncbi:Protein CONTINUOUS VASCULAR RING 1, partial [Ananas comosus]